MITAIDKFGQFAHKKTPFAHQAEILERSWRLPAFAIFWEMGCGKSKPILDTAARLFLAGEIDGVLIISDKGAYRNWIDYEVPLHLMDGIPFRMAYWNSSMVKSARSKAEQLLVARPDVLDILVMNVEGFSLDKAPVFAEAFLKAHYSMAVVDESTSIKNLSSARSKAVVELGALADFRRILTGTPVANSPLDIYAQAEFLGKKLLGYDSYVAFRNEYAVTMLDVLPSGRRHYRILGYRELKKLEESIRPWSSRLTKEECLDLPEKCYEVVQVELTPEQKKAYKEMKTLALTELSQGLATSTNALTLMGKLHGISCGHLRVDKKGEEKEGEMVDLPTNRIADLMALLKRLGEKAIVWANFRRDIERIKAALDKEYGPGFCVTYYGQTTATMRPESIRRFRTEPYEKCGVFLSTPPTGGKGNTLIEARYAVYYSNGLSLEDRLQSEDRIHRPGQTRRVTIFDMIARGTVDVSIMRAHRMKKDLASQVLGDWRTLFDVEDD